MPRRHILLSSMNNQGARPTTYTLDGSTRNAGFSALGLWQLLSEDKRPDTIWFLLTTEAKEKSWPEIQQEAQELNVSVDCIELPKTAVDDTREFLEVTAKNIPQGCRMTLDVTQGLRHHTFLFYALALYLTQIREIRIDGVWYCRLETDKRDDPKPLIDLKPVLDLAHWFHALATFQKTGSLREVSRLMGPGNTKDLTEQLSQLFLTGMPLEAGNTATLLLDHLGAEGRLLPDLPLAREVESAILEEIRPLAGPPFEAQPKDQSKAKKSVLLTDAELERQAAFIQRYFETGQLNLAFGLLREWIVNAIAFQQSRTREWLDRSTRERIERGLGGLGAVLRDKNPVDKKKYKHADVRHLLNDSQQIWGKRWNALCDIRNALQHHGMKAAVFDPDRKDICRAEEEFDARCNWQHMNDFGGGKGRLLICPIGLTPGVLFSALTHVKPQRALVICSAQSGVAIDEAQDRFSGTTEIQRLTMVDVYTGIDEFNAIVDTASKWLFEADEIHANLTGGTTLMGVLVSELNKRAQREYQRPLREFVLIDKRPPEEQRTDPWQIGEIHYLDGQGIELPEPPIAKRDRP